MIFVFVWPSFAPIRTAPTGYRRRICPQRTKNITRTRRTRSVRFQNQPIGYAFFFFFSCFFPPFFLLFFFFSVATLYSVYYTLRCVKISNIKRAGWNLFVLGIGKLWSVSKSPICGPCVFRNLRPQPNACVFFVSRWNHSIILRGSYLRLRENTLKIA